MEEEGTGDLAYFQSPRDFTLELPSMNFRDGSRLPLEKAVKVFPDLLVPWQFDDGVVEPDFILDVGNRVRMQYLYAAKQIFQRYFAQTARDNPHDTVLASLEPLSWPSPEPIQGLTMLYLEISILISLLQHNLSQTHPAIWRDMTNALLLDLRLYCGWIAHINIQILLEYAQWLQLLLSEYMQNEQARYQIAFESFHAGAKQPLCKTPNQFWGDGEPIPLEQPLLQLHYLYIASQLFQDSLYETSGILFFIIIEPLSRILEINVLLLSV